MSEQNNQPIFSLDKLYVKDVSLEVPNAPQIFLNREQPNIELNISFNTEKVEEGVYQTVLHAVVNAKIGEQQMFLIELDQAGIFQLKNIPADQMELIQNIECPNMIFPYLREAVTDLTTRAGFIPVILAPINFAYLYQQKQAQIQAQAQSTAPETIAIN
ncbi:protein-export chaperone SecB [Aquella oligotrophica]|jgi:preprotein translocase subunit SecB|uniref:Protein-export protein SecB n=1 Tax=Aquella oligotrophica TaxID=2067065 RepID=A0A2I7N474_9NEIS|nr:protein-export chaperone SecB [Aquella oligotrophica]AUR51231.1 protein-export chaperone SecB [Aquella oligotrophica]